MKPEKHKTKQSLLENLRKELEKLNYDTSGLSDEELENLCKKVGIEILNLAELN